MSSDNHDGIRWIPLPSHGDNRGFLTSIESGRDIPFEIRRIFYMHHLTADRGGHAHLDTDQVAIAASGSFRMSLWRTDGWKAVFDLHDPGQGLYLPRMTFLEITHITADAVCLVLASTHYDMGQSLRSREAFLSHCSGRDVFRD